ncbi:MAG: hypothetical protein MUF54_00225 [Polyangiaceae bacterium]|nr:hypothetical protein [Polyangiaceae bacterium]
METGGKNKRWLIGLATLSGALVVLAIVGALAADPIAKVIVQRAARAYGVALDARDVQFRWGRLVLREASFGLQGVRGLRGTVKEATVILAWLTPTSAQLDGLSVAMDGSAATFSLELGTWAKENPEALRFPLSAVDAGLQWREAEGLPPWLVADGVRMEPTVGGVQLRAPRASVLGVPVAPVGASWVSDRTTVTFGFGNPDPADALVRMDIAHIPANGSATLVLRPVRLADLAHPLGVALPVPGDVILEGNAELSLQPDGQTGELAGLLRAKLRGYVPPHPKELDGIVFGGVTACETRFRIARDRRAVHLTDTTVQAGAFKLKGDGLLQREGDHGRIALKMAGHIPCSALAKSATAANVSGPMGALLGDVAGRVLGGTARVDVQINGDTRQLSTAQVDQHVTMGCGLKLP